MTYTCLLTIMFQGNLEGATTVTMDGADLLDIFDVRHVLKTIASRMSLDVSYTKYKESSIKQGCQVDIAISSIGGSIGDKGYRNGHNWNRYTLNFNYSGKAMVATMKG